MEVQEQISYDLNQEKIGKTFKVLIDKKEGGHFVGRTEFDSVEVDNEVLIDAATQYCRVGDFVNVKVYDATEFDLYATVVD
jgi:ribosomal protein S12 methylthiotransferase